MSEGTFDRMRLTGRSLKRDFARFVSATVLSLSVFSLYSIVDGIFVARGVSEVAMTAVNLSLPFSNFLFSVTVLLAVGTSTVLAVFLGEGRQQEADELFTQNLLVGAILGVVVTAVALPLCTPLARLLGAAAETESYVVSYLHGIVPFSAFYIISYMLEVLVKTDGAPRLATVSVTFGCLLNCVLDYVMIFRLDMGIFGAAFATGFSQFAVSCIYLTHFFRGKTTFHLRRFRFNARIYRRLLPLGVSDGLTELCTGLLILLYNHVVQRQLGSSGLVSYTIAAYINTLVVMMMVGVGQGIQPLVSYYRGRREPQTCFRLLRYALVTAAVGAAVIFAGLWVFAPQAASLFLKADPALLNVSVERLHRFSLSFLILGFNVVISAFMTAVERPRAAIAISAGRGLVIQSACLMALSAVFGGESIWLAAALSELLTLLVSLTALHRCRREGLSE